MYMYVYYEPRTYINGKEKAKTMGASLNKKERFHFLENVFPLFFILYKRTLFIKKFFTTQVSFCFYVMQFRKQKNLFYKSEASLCFTRKNNFCIKNKIKPV